MCNLEYFNLITSVSSSVIMVAITNTAVISYPPEYLAALFIPCSLKAHNAVFDSLPIAVIIRSVEGFYRVGAQRVKRLFSETVARLGENRNPA